MNKSFFFFSSFPAGGVAVNVFLWPALSESSTCCCPITSFPLPVPPPSMSRPGVGGVEPLLPPDFGIIFSNAPKFDCDGLALLKTSLRHYIISYICIINCATRQLLLWGFQSSVIASCNAYNFWMPGLALCCRMLSSFTGEGTNPRSLPSFTIRPIHQSLLYF